MHHLKQSQFLPISLEQAWDFFTTPVNLNKITPDEMVFKITSEVPDKVYEGLVINYKIKPMLNIEVDWTTEITHVKPQSYFVDVQIKGPYRIWHHEHHFKAVEGGVLMTDILYYDIGKSVFGWMAGKLFVHKKVKEIFSFREKTLEKYFGVNTEIQRERRFIENKI